VSTVMPLMLLAGLVFVLGAAAWRRPDPNHEFILELLQSRLELEVTGNGRLEFVSLEGSTR